MSKTLKLFSLFITILYFAGCKESAPVEWPVVVELDTSIKDNAHPLKAEVIEASYDFIYAKDFFVYQDSIMIVLNKPSKDGYFVEFYNLNSSKIINRFIQMGNGPGEMLNTLAHVRRNELFVHDFAKNQIAFINIDSVLLKPDYRIMLPIQFSNNVGSPFVTFYRDNELIMQNPFYFHDKGLKIDNKAPRFITTEADEMTSMQLRDHRYYTYNVSQGLIIPCQDKNRLIYASSFLDELEIYDMDLNPIKLITGPDNLIPTYRLDNGDQIVFNRIVPYSYFGFFEDNDCFYLSYIGDYFSGDIELRDFKSWIFKFDWDGNFIESFQSPEYISSISKSTDKDIFYAQGFDTEGTIVLWKLFPAE